MSTTSYCQVEDQALLKLFHMSDYEEGHIPTFNELDVLLY